MRWRLTVSFNARPEVVDRLRSLIVRNMGRASDVLNIDVTDWNIEQENP